MNALYRRHWLLRRIGRELCRSDPHLAAMLAIFARLYAAEAIVSTEQAGPHPARWLRSAATVLAACGRWVFRRAASACTAARRRFGGKAPDIPAAPYS
jgi:hypothetical protein